MLDVLKVMAVDTSEAFPDTIPQTDPDTMVENIVFWVFTAIGIIAVVIIIYGGIQYIISEGDSGKMQRAKVTVIYAVIGLIMTVVASVIVNFVIGALA